MIKFLLLLSRKAKMLIKIKSIKKVDVFPEKFTKKQRLDMVFRSLLFNVKYTFFYIRINDKFKTPKTSTNKGKKYERFIQDCVY